MIHTLRQTEILKSDRMFFGLRCIVLEKSDIGRYSVNLTFTPDPSLKRVNSTCIKLWYMRVLFRYEIYIFMIFRDTIAYTLYHPGDHFTNMVTLIPVWINPGRKRHNLHSRQYISKSMTCSALKSGCLFPVFAVSSLNIYRDPYMYGLNQSETTLHCIVISQ